MRTTKDMPEIFIYGHAESPRHDQPFGRVSECIGLLNLGPVDFMFPLCPHFLAQHLQLGHRRWCFTRGGACRWIQRLHRRHQNVMDCGPAESFRSAQPGRL